MITDEQRKSLELAVAALEREYGPNTIIRLDSKDIAPWPSISTGVLTLDLALGIGGLPLGRIVEVIGEAGSGKSTLALATVAEAQRQGLICAYIDIENALDPVYMQSIGVNVDELYLSQPSYGEQALQVVQMLVKTHAVSVIVIDSVSALVPKAELDGDIGDSTIGLQARLMSQAMRILSGAVAESKTLLIFINQYREKVGVYYGDNRVPSGGRALKFYSSVRLEVARKEDIKNKIGEFAGIKVRAKVVKNKLAPPLKTAEYDILYDKGMDSIGCIADIAIGQNIIVKKGGWYFYDETNIAQGRDNVVLYLKENEEFLKQIKEDILNARAA